jgi:hypothetical protein
LVQTFNSVDGNTDLSFTVTKFASGNGVFEISLTGGCANLIICTPPFAEARAKFADFVMAAIDAPSQTPTPPQTPPQVRR